MQRFSVVAFLAAATWLWNWQLAVIFVVLIFIHELGHKLLMQYFGYHDVQMFFVPFFGAAVSGVKENASQTQRALVALAGPLPGILVTAGVVIWLAQRGEAINDLELRAIAVDTAQIALWLNGINLLPLVPLDGGRFFHAVLYSRYPLFEAIGKLSAAAFFLAGAYLLQIWPLLLIGGVVLITTPATHRIATLARRLKEFGAVAAQPLHELSTPALLTNYTIARAALPSGSLNERIQLLRRAYSAALAQAASLRAALGLLLVYALGIASMIAGLWNLGAAFPLPPQPEFYPIQVLPN